MRDFQLPPPLWSIASYIHLSMAMKAGLALATLFWTQMSASQSFLGIRPGSWCVHAPVQSRLARPRLQRVRCGSSNMHTRTFAFSPRSGSVQVSSSGVVRKNGLSACGAFSDHAQRLKPVLAVSSGEHHTCAVRTDGQLVCFGFSPCGRCDVPTDLGPVLAVAAGAEHTCAVRTDGQLVCFRLTFWGGVTCQQIWDQFWQSQRADNIQVQCGQMVSSSALDSMDKGSVTCNQIWDQFWESQRANVILVQCGQMASSSALDVICLGSVMCQQIWDQFRQSQRADIILVQMVSSSALDLLIGGGVTCQQIWDQFWQSQRADNIQVQCGQMVSSCALDTMEKGSVTCQQIWDLFWQSQRAQTIHVPCGQMVSSSVLDAINLGNAACQQICHQLSGPLSVIFVLCSVGGWSARLLWRRSWEV